MKRTRSLPRTALVATLALIASSSNAQTQACFDAALQGQKLEREGRLHAARDAFVSCAQAACPEPVAKQCTAWVVSVNDALPTVVLVAHDEQGRELTDVSVTIDGAPEPLSLQARDIPLDPGRHTFRWRRGTGAVQETHVVLREHEKGRHLTVTFPSSTRRAAPVAAYVLAGTAVVATGVFGVFAVKGYGDLQGFGCDRECTPSQGSQVRREFVTADIALGVAALTLAGALWLFLSPGKDALPRRSEGWFSSGAVADF